VSDATDALRFVKGHGTQNDFVVLADPAAELGLDAARVAAICDRQRGIGADGLLRVSRAVALVERGVLDALPAGVRPDDWFMDYRNADGSIAEMCGNGVRVFAHYVRATGLVDTDTFTVGSRAGARPVIIHSHDQVRADVTVTMGQARVDGRSQATVGDTTYHGAVIDVGNPHLACVVPDLTAEQLAGIDFSAGVGLDAGVFPHGANLELVTPARPGGDGPDGTTVDFSAHMRVFERGVGETRSCGTGLVAAGKASLGALGRDTGSLHITVPGGSVLVTVDPDGATLRGPSVLVAEGRFRPGWSDEG